VKTITAACHREPEDLKANTLYERRQGRIGHKAPIEMAGIAEKLEFVAMEAITAVGGEMEQRYGGRDAEQNGPFGLARGIERP